MSRLLTFLCALFLSACASRHIPDGEPNVPWTRGNHITTLVDGKAFYPPMLSAIHSAKTSITFETFAYVGAPITTEFTQALAQKAVEGVKVHVILDAIGSKDLPPTHLDTLRKSGAQVKLYRPLNVLRPGRSNNRTHRKILIVDGHTAFTGGAGFALAWQHEWRDTQYWIKGPSVAQLQQSFAENWQELTGEKLKSSSYFPILAPAGSLKARVISDTPSNNSNPLAQGVLHAINSARHSLLLEQSYFVPNTTIRRALFAAAKRGVRIEIIVPGPDIDSKPTRYASQNHWQRYLKAGMKLYQYENNMMHGKLLLADNRLAIIGSGNIDDRSFFINDEANLHVLSKPFGRTQERMFRNDLKACREITLENLDEILAPWYQRFFSGMISSQL